MINSSSSGARILVQGRQKPKVWIFGVLVVWTLSSFIIIIIIMGKIWDPLIKIVRDMKKFQ